MRVYNILFPLIMLVVFGRGEVSGKIVIKGKWGTATNEFGLDTSEPPGAGPSCFTVSSIGNLYIADYVNSRIVIYDSLGDYLTDFPISEKVTSMDIDDNENIYCSHSKGLAVFNESGQQIASEAYNGRVRVDNDEIYIWADHISYELELNKKTGELLVVREIEKTAPEIIIMSNGNEFRRAGQQSKETGIVHLEINKESIPIKKISKGIPEIIHLDTTQFYADLYQYSMLDGDNNGNVYMFKHDHIVSINPQGILTCEIVPSYEDLRYINNMPYAPSGWVRVKNGHIYYMGATDDEFMIIEYEFQPVEE